MADKKLWKVCLVAGFIAGVIIGASCELLLLYLGTLTQIAPSSVPVILFTLLTILIIGAGYAFFGALVGLFFNFIPFKRVVLKAFVLNLGISILFLMPNLISKKYHNKVLALYGENNSLFWVSNLASLIIWPVLFAIVFSYLMPKGESK